MLICIGRTKSVAFRNLGVQLSLLLAFGIAGFAQAEPYLAVKNNQPCSACHVNPTGGGARNSYGAFYGSQQLPGTPGDQAKFDGGQITEGFRLGSDLRFNVSDIRYDDDQAENERGFDTHSGQVYVALQPKDSRFLLYIDQQLLPGGGRNREAFVLARLNKNHYIKAGNIMLPFGFRLQDDSAFTRQASQFNFNNNDTGAEWGMQFGSVHVNLAVSNGTSSQSNDDRNFQYLSRGEYIGSNWRIGTGYVFNNNEAGERTLFNVFGGFNLWGNTLLVELDQIEEVAQNPADEDRVQLVSLVELNREVAPGYNLKLTTEYWDPDDNIDENHRSRHSVILEYTPYAHVQLRGGLRVGDDIPQRAQGNFNAAFVQLHMYY